MEYPLIGEPEKPFEYGRTYLAEVTGASPADLEAEALAQARASFGPEARLEVQRTYQATGADETGADGLDGYESFIRVAEILTDACGNCRRRTADVSGVPPRCNLCRELAWPGPAETPGPHVGGVPG